MKLTAAAAVAPRMIKLPTYSEEEIDAMMADRNTTWPPSLEITPQQRAIRCGPRKRYQPPPTCHIPISLVGDGDPHQNYWNLRVMQPFDCDNGKCDVTHEDGKIIGWILG